MTTIQTDFTTWQRETLERFAADCTAEIKRLEAENHMLLRAWRAEVERNGTQPAQAGD